MQILNKLVLKEALNATFLRPFIVYDNPVHVLLIYLYPYF
jgi:hypothetical protein